MRTKVIVTALLATLMLTSASHAHFLWIVVDSEKGGKQVAKLYFAEEPEPGETHLVGKVAHARLRALTPEGSKKLKAKEVTTDDGGWLAAPLKSGNPRVVTASCRYGVYMNFLLNYSAKHVTAGAKDVATDELDLQMVAKPVDEGLQLQTLWQGEPVAGAELTVTDSDGKNRKLTADDDGKVMFSPNGAGRIGVLASHVEPEKSGEFKGKQYKETRYYTTLTVDVKGEASSDQADISASEVLASARKARAVWEEFPGLTAELVVNLDGKVERGTLEVDDFGLVTVNLKGDDAKKWAVQTWESLVQHRMPTGDFTEEAAYGEEEVSHPLGKKIHLKDDDLDSYYRIRGDVIAQVNRNMGASRFTISVMEVSRNPEDKYLPTNFTMTFWNNKTGELVTSQAHSHQYERIDGFDIPVYLQEYSTGDDSYHARVLTLENVRIGKSE